MCAIASARVPVALLMAVGLACSASAEPAAFHFQNGTSARDIPIEISSNHIYVSVTVGNGEKATVLLETGGAASAFDPDLAVRAGITLGDSAEAGGAGADPATAWRLNDVSYSLPGLSLSGQSLTAVSLRALESVTGHRMDGVLGFDFLRQFIVEIDYAGSRLHLYDPATWTYRGTGDSLSLDLTGPIPIVQGVLNDSIPARFFVDTGASMAVMVSRPFSVSHDLKHVANSTLEGPPGHGLGGAAGQIIARFDRFRVGRFELTDPLLGLSQAEAGIFASDEQDGVIGGEIWRRFRVILDYPHARMYLEPNQNFGAPFEHDMSGLVLRSGPPDNPGIVVSTILPGTPADSAGIEPGDVIQTIDGQPSSGKDLYTIRMMFRGVGKNVAVEYRRGAEVRSVVLRLRRLV